MQIQAFSSILVERTLPERPSRRVLIRSPIIGSGSIPLDPMKRCIKERRSHAAKMERWLVYTVTLQIFATIVHATEDFRHISYEAGIYYATSKF
ncbi:hypothetical protein X777_06326 [Ooceraea biroi]|uniref:Uncharacterized protein n=1 Tax=Ooceraea biroi TaxID=2015173 RepID=A0A026WAW9_OOCBI|nr:hypothetical protein X777_06326 [Ooceraea biroi]